MINIQLLSKEYKDKAPILEFISVFAHKHGYRFREKEDIIGPGDVAMDKLVGEWYEYYLEFWVTEKEEFMADERDVSIHNDERYHTMIDIEYAFDGMGYLNMFLEEFLPLYPDMLVSDEGSKPFYSWDQIQKKEVPDWMLTKDVPYNPY